MAKEKWYMTTGRESEETKLKATKIMLSNGVVHEKGDWAWSKEPARTGQRLFDIPKLSHIIVAYTLGEKA